jgi:hypothetical protein
MKIMLGTMAEVFEVFDVEIVDSERHTQIFAADSHFASLLLRRLGTPGRMVMKDEPLATAFRDDHGKPRGNRHWLTVSDRSELIESRHENRSVGQHDRPMIPDHYFVAAAGQPFEIVTNEVRIIDNDWAHRPE